jgi:hypothetical protein
MDLFERSAGKRPGNAVDEPLEGTLDRVVFSGTSGECTVVRLKVAEQAEPVTAVGWGNRRRAQGRSSWRT